MLVDVDELASPVAKAGTARKRVDVAGSEEHVCASRPPSSSTTTATQSPWIAVARQSPSSVSPLSSSVSSCTVSNLFCTSVLHTLNKERAAFGIRDKDHARYRCAHRCVVSQERRVRSLANPPSR
jgi:hypothetical protein